MYKTFHTCAEYVFFMNTSFKNIFNLNIRICIPFYCFIGSKAQYLFLNLKKKYLRKRKELKDSNKSGTSADAVTKAEKAFRLHAFLSWLDEFTQVREGRSNLPSQKSNTPSAEDGEEELEKKEENADEDGIQTEYSTLAEVFDDLPETEKVEKNPKKTAEKESCYRVQQRRAILREKSLR